MRLFILSMALFTGSCAKTLVEHDVYGFNLNEKVDTFNADGYDFEVLFGKPCRQGKSGQQLCGATNISTGSIEIRCTGVKQSPAPFDVFRFDLEETAGKFPAEAVGFILKACKGDWGKTDIILTHTSSGGKRSNVFPIQPKLGVWEVRNRELGLQNKRLMFPGKYISKENEKKYIAAFLEAVKPELDKIAKVRNEDNATRMRESKKKEADYQIRFAEAKKHWRSGNFHGTATAQDLQTGLTWSSNFGLASWFTGKRKCEKFGLGWRLPKAIEWKEALNHMAKDIIPGINYPFFWTADDKASTFDPQQNMLIGDNEAWVINLDNGQLFPDKQFLTKVEHGLVCVRQETR